MAKKRTRQRLPTKKRLRLEREGAANTLHREISTSMTQESKEVSKENRKKQTQKKQVRNEAIRQKNEVQKKSKLESEAEYARRHKKKLEFVEAEGKKPSKIPRSLTHTAPIVVSAKVHKAVRSANADDNAGVESAEFLEGSAEATAHTTEHAVYGRKLRKYSKAARLEAKADKANIEALFQQSLSDHPELSSNLYSRWRQKQAIKKEYAALKSGAQSGSTAYKTGSTVASRVKDSLADMTEKAFRFIRSHSNIILIILAMALIVILISSCLSSCSVMFTGSGSGVLGTSFTAEDEDIRGAEDDYRAMENELRRKIQEAENDDDYDEHRMNVDEIGHNPWELAALLTVLYEDYSRSEVQRFLRQLFEAQYEFSKSSSVETVTETKTVRVGESLGIVTTSGYCSCPICCGIWSGGPTASGVYPTANHTIAVDAYNPFVPMGTKVVMNGVEYKVEDTGAFARYGVQFDVYYDDHTAASMHGHKQWECYLADDNGSNSVEVTTTETKRVLSVQAVNHSLRSVINSLELTDEEMERLDLLIETKGNRDYLFADDIYSNPTGDYLHYDIPGEALTDAKFRNMIREAEKYLGYPYVWGGASPSTSFDCSGFVSWVINHCGNGWNVGRQTAEGLRGCCDIIRKSEAKPGDLIFFQGTYNTSGASHVGIYVGNGMMIHCGNPISYASIETSYWQDHFYCMGRLR